MLFTDFPAGGGGKIKREDIIAALGYTPPQEDTQGVNLAPSSAKEIVSNAYRIFECKLKEPIELNRHYTITVWGNISDGQAFQGYFGSTANDTTGNLKKIDEGVYSTDWIQRAWKRPDDDKTVFRIYTTPNTPANTNTVTRVKIEKGAVTNPIWTPAPEDYVSLEARVAALEQKSGQQGG